MHERLREDYEDIAQEEYWEDIAQRETDRVRFERERYEQAEPEYIEEEEGC